MDDDDIPDNDDALWTDVMSGAAETLNTLQSHFKGDPQLGLAAVALTMSYLLAMTKTPEDRRHALYECVEDRVGEAKATLTPELERLMFHISNDSKVVH